jgi:ABC-type phosphate transport system permease subunit
VVEVLVLGILSVLLAIPAGYESAVYLSARASRAWFHVQIVSELGDYLRILIPGLFLMPAAAIPAIRVILREPMEKSLRERRCG